MSFWGNDGCIVELSPGKQKAQMSFSSCAEDLILDRGFFVMPGAWVVKKGGRVIGCDGLRSVSVANGRVREATYTRLANRKNSTPHLALGN